MICSVSYLCFHHHHTKIYNIVSTTSSSIQRRQNKAPAYFPHPLWRQDHESCAFQSSSSGSRRAAMSTSYSTVSRNKNLPFQGRTRKRWLGECLKCVCDPNVMSEEQHVDEFGHVTASERRTIFLPKCDIWSFSDSFYFIFLTTFK